MLKHIVFLFSVERYSKVSKHNQEICSNGAYISGSSTNVEDEREAQVEDGVYVSLLVMNNKYFGERLSGFHEHLDNL